MWNFTRKRQTAGNICLVLFMAFLFTVLVTPFAMVDSAYAANGQGITAVQKQSGVWNEVNGSTISPDSNGAYALLIGLAVDPLSPVNFNTLNIKFEGASSTLTVYAGEMTADSVYYSTYSKVYAGTYTVPSTFKFSTTDIVYGKVYDGTTFLFNVALTLSPPPPVVPYVPPVPPSEPKEDEEEVVEEPVQEPQAPTVEQPVVETVVESGNLTQTLTSEGTVETVLVANEDKLVEQMTTAPAPATGVAAEIVIEAASTVAASTTVSSVVAMTNAILETAAATNTTVAVKTAVANVALPPAAVVTADKVEALAQVTTANISTLIDQAKSAVVTPPVPQTSQTAAQIKEQQAQTTKVEVIKQLTAGLTSAQAKEQLSDLVAATQEVAKKVEEGNATFKLETKKVTAASIALANTLATTENANLKAVGNPISLNANYVVDLTKPVAGISQVKVPVKTFAKPITVTFSAPDEIKKQAEQFMAQMGTSMAALQALQQQQELQNQLNQRMRLQFAKIESSVNEMQENMRSLTRSIPAMYSPFTGMVIVPMTGFSDWVLLQKVWVFSDVIDHWATADIEALADEGVVKGVTDNKFAPDATVTRAEFATMLVKALGLFEVNASKATFKDVKSTDWFYSMVETAARNGLVAGAHGYFNPNAKISRQEMAAMITNALKLKGKASAVSSSDAAALLSKFSDQKQIADWAKTSVAGAVKDGIIVGRTADTFVPNANATRAEGSVMINRVLKRIK